MDLLLSFSRTHLILKLCQKLENSVSKINNMAKIVICGKFGSICGNFKSSCSIFKLQNNKLAEQTHGYINISSNNAFLWRISAIKRIFLYKNCIFSLCGKKVPSTQANSHFWQFWLPFLESVVILALETTRFKNASMCKWFKICAIRLIW